MKRTNSNDIHKTRSHHRTTQRDQDDRNHRDHPRDDHRSYSRQHHSHREDIARNPKEDRRDTLVPKQPYYRPSSQNYDSYKPGKPYLRYEDSPSKGNGEGYRQGEHRSISHERQRSVSPRRFVAPREVDEHREVPVQNLFNETQLELLATVFQIEMIQKERREERDRELKESKEREEKERKEREEKERKEREEKEREEKEERERKEKVRRELEEKIRELEKMMREEEERKEEERKVLEKRKIKEENERKVKVKKQETDKKTTHTIVKKDPSEVPILPIMTAKNCPHCMCGKTNCGTEQTGNPRGHRNHCPTYQQYHRYSYCICGESVTSLRSKSKVDKEVKSDTVLIKKHKQHCSTNQTMLRTISNNIRELALNYEETFKSYQHILTPNIKEILDFGSRSHCYLCKGAVEGYGHYKVCPCRETLARCFMMFLVNSRIKALGLPLMRLPFEVKYFRFVLDKCKEEVAERERREKEKGKKEKKVEGSLLKGEVGKVKGSLGEVQKQLLMKKQMKMWIEGNKVECKEVQVEMEEESEDLNDAE